MKDKYIIKVGYANKANNALRMTIPTNVVNALNIKKSDRLLIELNKDEQNATIKKLEV